MSAEDHIRDRLAVEERIQYWRRRHDAIEAQYKALLQAVVDGHAARPPAPIVIQGHFTGEEVAALREVADHAERWLNQRQWHSEFDTLLQLARGAANKVEALVIRKQE